MLALTGLSRSWCRPAGRRVAGAVGRRTAAPHPCTTGQYVQVQASSRTSSTLDVYGESLGWKPDTLVREETGASVEVPFPRPLKPKQSGVNILHSGLWNKGTAFDMPERDRLNLRGLLPPCVKTIDNQVERVLTHLREKDESNVRKNLYLQDLHSRNETLYHRVVVDHIAEIAPLIYTPTVGSACQEFGHQYRRARGMYFSRNDRGLFSSMVWNWPHNEVHVIVVTDGSRILGLGDLGVHGMGIPIGKLALYCAAGGIAPHRVLPVMLDVGTNNAELSQDPEYLGVAEPRLEGPEYFDMVEEFMQVLFYLRRPRHSPTSIAFCSSTPPAGRAAKPVLGAVEEAGVEAAATPAAAAALAHNRQPSDRIGGLWNAGGDWAMARCCRTIRRFRDTQSKKFCCCCCRWCWCWWSVGVVGCVIVVGGGGGAAAASAA